MSGVSFVLTLILFCSFLFQAWGQQNISCSDILDQAITQGVSGYPRLNEQQILFLKEIFLPLTGRGGILTRNDNFRTCSITGNCITFPADRSVSIIWDSSPQPWIETKRSEKTLHLPLLYDFEEDRDAALSLVQNLLVGIPIHPLNNALAARIARIKFGEKPEVLRTSAREALIASQRLMKFVIVSPPGTDNLPFFVEDLATHVETGLYLFTVKRSRQEEAAAAMLRASAPNVSFELLSESDGLAEQVQLAVISKIIEASKTRPVALVGQTSRLLKRIDDAASHAGVLPELRFNLRAVYISDPINKASLPLVTSLVDKHGSTARMLAAFSSGEVASADPAYGNKAYWLYLDKPGAGDLGPLVRGPDASFEQLKLAIRSGESVPIRGVQFFTSEEIGLRNAPLFIANPGSKGSDFILNPKASEKLMRFLLGQLPGERAVVVSTQTFNESEKLAGELQKIMFAAREIVVLPPRSSARDMAVARQRVMSGRTQYLFVTRGLEAELFFPGASVYIDTSRLTSPQEFLGKMGILFRAVGSHESLRIIGLAENKKELDEAGFGILTSRIAAGDFGIPFQKPPPAETRPVESKPRVKPPKAVEPPAVVSAPAPVLKTDKEVRQQKRVAKAAKQAALDLNDFFSAKGYFPSYKYKRERALYWRVCKYRHHPAFWRALLPEIREAYKRKD